MRAVKRWASKFSTCFALQFGPGRCPCNQIMNGNGSSANSPGLCAGPRKDSALKIMRPNPAPLFLRLRVAGSKNWFAGNADEAQHTCAARYTLHFQELPRRPFPEARADINRDSSRKRYYSSEPRRSLVVPPFAFSTPHLFVLSSRS